MAPLGSDGAMEAPPVEVEAGLAQDTTADIAFAGEADPAGEVAPAAEVEAGLAQDTRADIAFAASRPSKSWAGRGGTPPHMRSTPRLV